MLRKRSKRRLGGGVLELLQAFEKAQKPGEGSLADAALLRNMLACTTAGQPDVASAGRGMLDAVLKVRTLLLLFAKGFLLSTSGRNGLML